MKKGKKKGGSEEEVLAVIRGDSMKPGPMRENDQKLWYNKYVRRERITYIGAYHHVMNRGYDGKDIFAGNSHKSRFPDYLEASTKRMKI
jgi:hypothetical protein